MNDISKKLIQWYQKNGRALPWRTTRDPYLIWVSEIIFQQTRIDQGLAYYQRFTSRFPDIGTLAEASADEVLKLWQGLGYYSRARNMHETAKVIMKEHAGHFPDSLDALKRLKGIGEYTANAIGSVCYGTPSPVVDGNVKRVVSRLYELTEPVDTAPGLKRIRSILEALIDGTDPGTFNQAIMDFGALQCTVSRPDCAACPLSEYCKGKADPSAFPVVQKKVIKKDRFIIYFIIHIEWEGRQGIILRKRLGNDIWKGLYDFPSIEDEEEISPEHALKLLAEEKQDILGEVRITHISRTFRHILTHRNLIARFVHIDAPFVSRECIMPPCHIVEPGHFNEYPVPRLIDRYIREGFVDYLK